MRPKNNISVVKGYWSFPVILMISGVFYTKKSNAKYNFQSSKGAFPPLPTHLQLDKADSMEEIKLFVQHQARAAARRMETTTMYSTTTDELAPAEIGNPLAASNRLHEPSSSGSCITGNSELIITSSSEQLVEIDSEFQIPMDLDYLGRCFHADLDTAEETEKNMFLDYTNYLSQQGAPDQQPAIAWGGRRRWPVDHHQLKN